MTTTTWYVKTKAKYNCSQKLQRLWNGQSLSTHSTGPFASFTEAKDYMNWMYHRGFKQYAEAELFPYTVQQESQGPRWWFIWWLPL